MLAELDDMRWVLENPEKRVDLAKAIITLRARNVPGLTWVGGYGSFWSLTTQDPKDIDLALEISSRHRDKFHKYIGHRLTVIFGKEIDYFPLDMVREKRGKQGVISVVQQSLTLWGTTPRL